jgi:hypothetical protein
MGNTNATADVTCEEGYLLKPDPKTLEGTTPEECCEAIPNQEPEIEYRWQATTWTPAVCPPMQCEEQIPLTRAVTCMEIKIYSNDLVTRAEASNTTSCSGDAPADTWDCPALQEGDICVDYDPLTTGDVCPADGGACRGQKMLKSALTFPVDAATVALPAAGASAAELDSSDTAVVIKNAIRPALVSVLGPDVVVTVLGMQAGSLVVDYTAAVPADVATDSPTKQTATLAVQDSVVWPALPAADGVGTIDAGTPVVDLLQNYAYSRTAGCLAATDCSAACGYEGEEADDVYQCLEDGSPVATAACEAAGIGPVPTSTSTCCPPADEETCTPSDEMITDPCPEGWETDASLSATEKAVCLIEEEGIAVGVIIVIVIVGLLLVSCLVYKLCCGDAEAKYDTKEKKGVDEDAAAQSLENEEERRKQLEGRLATVRDGLGEP